MQDFKIFSFGAFVNFLKHYIKEYVEAKFQTISSPKLPKESNHQKFEDRPGVVLSPKIA